MSTDIIIDENNTIDRYDMVSGHDIHFALCSDIKHGRKQIATFFTCRDYINDMIYNYYNGRICLYSNNGSSRELLDTNRLRLLITDNFKNYRKEQIEIWKNNLYVAKHIVNLYEKLAGFKTKSVIAEVTHSNKKITRCWQLVGPKEWMRYSHLVSMVTLILRSVVRCPRMLDTPESLEEAEKMMTRLRNECKPHSDYITYLPACIPLFSKLMKNFDKIFVLTPVEVHKNTIGSNASWHNRGGIYALCTCNTMVPAIDKMIGSVKKSNNS